MKRANLDLGLRIRAAAGHIPSDCMYTSVEIMRRHPEFQGQSEGRYQIFSRRMIEEYGFEKRALTHFPGTPFAPNEQSTETLALISLRAAMAQAPGWTPDVFVHGTTTSSRYTGSQATSIAGTVGWHLPSYETRCGCATSLGSMHLVWTLIKGGMEKAALTCSETLSKVINPASRDDWFGLGDGAATLFVERDETNPEFRVLRSVYFTKGELADLYTTPALLPPTAEALAAGGYFLKGDPLRLREEAKKGYNEMLSALIPEESERRKLKWIVPHQVNLGLVREVVAENELPGELILNAQEIGNIGGTSILYSLTDAINKKTFASGDRFLMMSVGGGLSIAGQLWEKC